MDKHFWIKLFFLNEHIKLSLLVMMLQYLVASFTRIHIWLIRDIIQAFNLELFHFLFDYIGLVDPEIIHEYRDSFKWTFLSQLYQVFNKFILVYRFLKYLAVLKTFLLRDCQYECIACLIRNFLRNSNIRSKRTTRLPLYSFWREYSFIKIYETIVLLLQFCDFLLNILSPLLIFNLFFGINEFYEFDFLFLNFVKLIDFGQQRRVDTVVWKLSMK